MPDPINIDSIDPLIERYRVFLLDQFGVLHDGSKPYPDALAALRKLARHDRHCIIISNSGKRAAVNDARMQQLGFPRSSYSRLISSGEVAWSLLRERIESNTLQGGASCYLFSNDADQSAIAGLNLTTVDDIDRAELILLSGIRGEMHDLQYYQRLLQGPLQRDVPCICTNPDKWSLANGGRVIGAGRVAEYYEQAGGRVSWIGKPHGQIYRFILRSLNPADLQQIVCIGDSVEHDIAGAQSQHLATALVRTGIHSGADTDELKNLYKHYSATPDYLLAAFT